MHYKIMFWLGIATGTTLVIVNMANAGGQIAFLFWKQSVTWIVILVAIIIGIFIGLGIPHMFDKKGNTSNEEDLFFN